MKLTGQRHIAFRIGRNTAWAIATVFNILVALWLVAAAYGGMLNPERSAAGALVAMTFPFAVGVTVAVAAANMVLFRRLAILNALSLLACLGPLLTYCPLNVGFRGDAAASDTTGRTFSLLTYNVYGFKYYGSEPYDGTSPNLTISYILSRDPDIVVLQEGNDLSPLARWRFNREQFDSLMARYPYRFGDAYGLALLSKYPAYEIPLDKEAFKQDVTADFMCYRLSVEGHKLYIFNVHLQSIGLTPDDKALYHRLTEGKDIDRTEINEARHQLVGKLAEAYRRRAVQARALRANLDSVATTGANVIVCGDFNDIPGCYASRTVRGRDMTDAFAHAGFGPSITYHANRFYFRIDHIFYRGDMDCIDISRKPLDTSDHYPLFAVFEWTD